MLVRKWCGIKCYEIVFCDFGARVKTNTIQNDNSGGGVAEEEGRGREEGTRGEIDPTHEFTIQVNKYSRTSFRD